MHLLRVHKVQTVFRGPHALTTEHGLVCHMGPVISNSCQMLGLYTDIFTNMHLKSTYGLLFLRVLIYCDQKQWFKLYYESNHFKNAQRVSRNNWDNSKNLTLNNWRTYSSLSESKLWVAVCRGQIEVPVRLALKKMTLKSVSSADASLRRQTLPCISSLMRFPFKTRSP